MPARDSVNILSDPDFTLDTDAATLQTCVFGDGTLANAERSGDLALEGKRRIAQRLLRCFPRSVPATASS